MFEVSCQFNKHLFYTVVDREMLSHWEKLEAEPPQYPGPTNTCMNIEGAGDLSAFIRFYILFRQRFSVACSRAWKGERLKSNKAH